MRLFLFLFFFVTNVHALEPPIYTPSEGLEYEPNKVWLAPPLSAVVGFGTGHLVQNQFDSKGYLAVALDSLGWLLVLTHLGNCDDSCHDTRNIGWGILAGSHLAQTVDTSIWAYNYYDKRGARAFLLPTKKGLTFMASYSF